MCTNDDAIMVGADDDGLEMGAAWSIACFTRVKDGCPERGNYTNAQDFYPGEFALDCAGIDQQRVFFSVGRGQAISRPA